jgi:hypothetical protein
MLASVMAATLLAAADDAQAQVGDRPVCLRAPTGALSCLYESFAECRMLAKDNVLGIACVERPSTTGGPDATRPLDAPRGIGPNSLDRLPR